MLMPPLHSTVVGFTKCCPETMILFLHSRDGKHFKSTAIFHITVFGDNTKTSFFNAQETEVSFKMSIAQCDNKCFFNFAVMVLHFSSNVTSMLKMEIKMGLSSDKYHGNHETKVYRSSTAPDYPKWWKLHGYTYLQLKVMAWPETSRATLVNCQSMWIKWFHAFISSSILYTMKKLYGNLLMQD